MKWDSFKSVPVPVFLLFSIGAFLLFLIFHGDHYTSGPMGEHMWRQTDGLSIAYRYHLDDRPFFSPATFNLGPGGDGEAVSEFPVWYYVTAHLYDLLGFHDFMLRYFHWIVLFGGLALFSVRLYSSSTLYFFSLAIPLLWSCQPLMAYYSFNYLPDTLGLGFSLIGLFLYDRPGWSRSRQLLTSAPLFIFASLSKPSFLILPIALLSADIMSGLGQKKKSYGSGTTVHHSILPPFIQLAVIMALVLTWVWWSSSYNRSHQSEVFLSAIVPFWKNSWNDLYYLGNHYMQHLFLRFSSWPGIIVLAGGLTLLARFHRKVQKRELYRLLFLTLGVFSVFALFTVQFFIHDYYSLLFYLPVLYLFQAIARPVSQWKEGPSVFFRLILPSGLVILLILGAMDARNHLLNQYDKENQFYQEYYNYNFLKRDSLSQFLSSNGLTYSDHKVISLTDESTNISLYCMGLRGFSGHNGTRAEELEEHVHNGATHLIVGHPWKPLDEEVLSFLQFPLDTFGGTIFLYDLQPLK